MESLENPFILFFVRWIEDDVLLLDVRPFYATISVLFYIIYQPPGMHNMEQQHFRPFPMRSNWSSSSALANGFGCLIRPYRFLNI